MRKNLIILGKKYVFNKIETELLKLKFKIFYINFPDEYEILVKKFSSIAKNKENVLVIPSGDIDEKIKSLIEEFSLKVIPLPAFMEKYLNKLYIPYEFKKLEYIENIKPYNTTEYIVKRIIDFLVGIPLAIFSIPIVIYSIYRIKRESPEGSILYKQARVGKNNKEFIAYKFRSMVPDAEKGLPKFASKNDPRVFKWGAFMRKTRIDELPQLINILKGEMHLVGPRPERKFWTDVFEQKIPYYNVRHIVAPGITGWAQVNYPYGSNTEDARQKLMYDLYYIKHWSLWLEIKTLFKTVGVILKKQGQ